LNQPNTGGGLAERSTGRELEQYSAQYCTGESGTPHLVVNAGTTDSIYFLVTTVSRLIRTLPGLLAGCIDFWTPVGLRLRVGDLLLDHRFPD
jgi:hypothetical protein